MASRSSSSSTLPVEFDDSMLDKDEREDEDRIERRPRGDVAEGAGAEPPFDVARSGGVGEAVAARACATAAGRGRDRGGDCGPECTLGSSGDERAVEPDVRLGGGLVARSSGDDAAGDSTLSGRSSGGLMAAERVPGKGGEAVSERATGDMLRSTASR